MHLTDPDLAAIGHTGHRFFTRQGGVSTGIYAALNCGPGSDDDPAAVTENRSRAAADFGLPASALISNYQVHSPDVVHVTEPWARENAPKADAMVTDRPGIALGVLTADCGPVLLADTTARVIGAAHAGWRGAVGGVLTNTVDAMVGLGGAKERIIAVVGPCIAQASYEVGAGHRDAFEAQDHVFFAPGADADHWQFDLRGFIAARLVAAGVTAVRHVDYDSYADPDRFFSYRRTTHRNEPDYGRNLSAIHLRPA